MKKNKLNRLSLIRGLMLASQLLLLLFVSYWLRTEYFKEKSQLQKEITVELLGAKRQVVDSIIFEKVIAPTLLAKSKNHIKTTYTFNSSANKAGKKKATVSIYSTDSINHKKEPKYIQEKKFTFPKDLLVVNKHLLTDSLDRVQDTFIQFSSIDEANAKQMSTRFSSALLIHRDNSQSAPEELINAIYKIVYTAMLQDSSFKAGHLPVLSDSIRLMYTFENIMVENGWHFNAEWVRDSSENTAKSLVIALDDEQQMNISGYNGFLFNKILPQSSFSLLLLALTAIAFLLTFRSLNKQIKLSELKNGLISNMSHELKTPVSTVKVALEALDNFDVVNQPVKAREYIHMAMLETHRLELLVNKALNTSLIEQGKMTLQRQHQNILELVENIVAALQLRLQQIDTSITVTSSGENFLMNIDKLHVQGAVMNIIDNSIKYGKAPTHIDIKVVARVTSIAIEISDNGPGIPQQYIRQVFEKFFRVPEGDQHNVKGYGLGLSYVHQVMELHSGLVVASNKAEGGCMFCLQFYRGR